MLNSLDCPGAPADTRVVVAMSGGVDSSVVAAQLKREGYDVVGVTLQLYDHGIASAKPGACCAGADIDDARRVADAIGIPHYVLDYESRFRSAVIDRFADSYARGETPIPCVDCNRSVKFRDLLGLADDLGAAVLATGHYAATARRPDGARELRRALDPGRDQSYFLYATTPEQLDRVRFPLGEMTKEAVRQLAAELGLSVAAKPDSQDICFVPSGRYTDLVERLRPDAVRPGEIVDQAGQVLGQHRGIVHFTVGQRRGLGISSSEPLYVVALDADRARVVVGPKEALATTALVIADVNWLAEPWDENRPVAAKVRSTRDPCPALVRRRPAGPMSSCFRPRTACRRARPASCTTAPGRGRGCSVVAPLCVLLPSGAPPRPPDECADHRRDAGGYRRWAPVYDVIYDRLTGPAARAAVRAVEACGPRILEVGVGTGLSLAYYSPTSEVHGIDLSDSMLARAREKAARLGHVKSLQVMDACHLTFEDGAFDGATAQFLITLVPDPEGALDEMARVIRPGGEIVLANHFGADDGPLARIEGAISPLCRRIGWSSDFKASRIARWAETAGLTVVGISPVFPGGFFKIMRLRKPAR
jgi:tRNA-specific 2-thiouridylase